MAVRSLWFAKIKDRLRQLRFQKAIDNEPTDEEGARLDRMLEGHTPHPTTGQVHLGPATEQQGLLFSLPPELRQSIYRHVFGPSLIHVEPIGERLAHVTCEDWRSWNVEREHSHCRDGEVMGVVRIDQSEDPNDQLSTLLLTCRQMYVFNCPLS